MILVILARKLDSTTLGELWEQALILERNLTFKNLYEFLEGYILGEFFEE